MATSTTPTAGTTDPRPVVRAPGGLTIADVACKPEVPPWEIALVAGWNWSTLHEGDYAGQSAARDRASAAIDALPRTDPRHLEAHCRAAFAHQNSMNLEATERHLQIALGALRARGIADAERRYDGLRDPVYWIGINLPDGRSKDARVWLSTTTGAPRDPDRCRDPDVAFLELALADVYHHVKADAKTGGFTPRRPTTRATGRLAADHAAALQDEVEAALGPNHRFAFTMREHMTWYCREREQRKVPGRCPDLETLRRKNLEGRLAALGPDDPDTRRNMLFVGAMHMEGGRTGEATAMFERAAAGDARDEVWVVAQQLLSGIELASGNKRSGFARLQRVADVIADAIPDSYWGTSQAWALHEGAAIRTGHRGEATRAKAAHEQVHRDYHYVGPGGSGLAMIAWTTDAPALHAEAIEAVVATQTHALRWLDRPGGRPAERAWRTAELDVALQCRALLRDAAGDGPGATADLAALERLRAHAPPPG